MDRGESYDVAASRPAGSVATASSPVPRRQLGVAGGMMLQPDQPIFSSSAANASEFEVRRRRFDQQRPRCGCWRDDTGSLTVAGSTAVASTWAATSGSPFYISPVQRFSWKEFHRIQHIVHVGVRETVALRVEELGALDARMACAADLLSDLPRKGEAPAFFHRLVEDARRKTGFLPTTPHTLLGILGHACSSSQPCRRPDPSALERLDSNYIRVMHSVGLRNEKGMAHSRRAGTCPRRRRQSQARNTLERNTAFNNERCGLRSC
jgi:hypothetical protein